MSVFVAVAEANGFAAAARRLNLSPPSVTRAVTALERHLGARLLHRTTRSVQLTEAGARYLADCRRLLAELAAAERHAAGRHAAPEGPVSLTASVLFGREVVAPVLFGLLDRYPRISVDAMFVDRVVHMYDEGIDVAVRIAELPDSELVASRVGSVRRVLCAAPAYLDRHGRPETPDDLAGYATIEFASSPLAGAWRFAGTRPQRVTPNASLRVNTADVAIAAATAGRGITRVLSYMIAPQVTAGALEIVLSDFEPAPLPVQVVHKEAGQTSARVRAVVDHLVDGLRQSDRLDR